LADIWSFLDNNRICGLMKNLRPQQVGILIAAAVTVLLWLVPGGQLIVLPLQYLNTHLHELSHALAAVFSGGSVDTIHVFADGSGVTQASISHPVIVGSAGYVGSSLIGAAIIVASRDERSARRSLLAVFGLLLIECLLWLRGDAIGMTSGFSYMLLFLFLGLNLRGRLAVFAAQFVGLQQCLNALQAVLVLLNPRILAFTDSDATILKDATGVPAILWSSGWALLSVTLMVLAFLSAWSKPRDRPGSQAAAR